MRAVVSLALICVIFSVGSANPARTSTDSRYHGGGGSAPAAAVHVDGNRVNLTNGYTFASFNLANPQIDLLHADYDGAASWGANVLAGWPLGDPQRQRRAGVVLERVDSIQGLWTTVAASSASLSPPSALDRAVPRVVVLSNTSEAASVRIEGVVDAPQHGGFAGAALVSNWTLRLDAGQRAVEVSVDVEATRSVDVAGVRLSVYAAGTQTSGFFDRGVASLVGNAPQPMLPSNNTLHRAIFLGGDSAPGASEVGSRDGLCLDVQGVGGAPLSAGTSEVILLSGTRPQSFFQSGLQLVFTGNVPPGGNATVQQGPDAWVHDWRFAPIVPVSQGARWSTALLLTPSDANFPAPSLPSAMPRDDLHAMLSGPYASTVGGLTTYQLPGRISSELLHPLRTSYVGEYTFFDPDAALSCLALLYTGDPYLAEQARALVETSMDAMRGNQVPHNFKVNTPIFTAISGANQTGPNSFLVTAAVAYARATGNFTWLSEKASTIALAMSFLTDMYDPKMQLLFVPGPLWIDTFRRSEFASDTNVYMVHLLRDVAQAFEALGSDSPVASLVDTYRSLADNITEGINQHLWSGDGDHYVTQLSRDGSTRDFVDYDTNLMAVAFGIAAAGGGRDRELTILDRVDSGTCTHVRPTYVSEKFYGPDDVYADNVGDGVVAMGRIAWVDALARAAVQDGASLMGKVLNPIRSDVLGHTWLYERYICDPARGVYGQPAHSNFFVEYPEVLTMISREAVYGIFVGLTNVSVTPVELGKPFSYAVGNLGVEYSQPKTCLTLPVEGVRHFAIGGMKPDTTYTIEAVDGPKLEAATNGAGHLEFTWTVAPAAAICASVG